MPDEKVDQFKLSEQEREDERLEEIVTANLPLPKTPSSHDRAQILHYISSEPSLTTFRKNGLEKFLANVGVIPDGRVVCTVTPPLDERHAHLRPILWGSRFGACVRLIIRTPKRPLQAVFIPGEKPFDALQSNRIIFVSYRMGHIQAINEYDFASSVNAKSAFETLIARCVPLHAEIENDDGYIANTDLIRANSVSAKFFSDHWTRLEWLQRGWVNACADRYRRAVSLIKDRYTDIVRANNLPELREHYDLLRATISTLSKNDLSANSKIQEVIARYKTYPISQVLLDAFRFEDEQKLTDQVAEKALRSAWAVAHCLWCLQEIDAQLSDWGRLQISWDTSGKKSRPIEIDPYNFPIEHDKDAASYWECKVPYILAHRDALLSPSDLQIDPDSYVGGFLNWQVDLDEDDAEETIKQLLNEAAALRESTIPPNAFVEVSCGPFVGVEVTEIGGDVFFIWWTANNRYWSMSVDVDKQSFDQTEVITRDPQNPFNRKSQLAIQLLMSAIIRDFWVVTERQKLFGIKVSRAVRKGSGGNPSRVVYLPRVRYLGSKIDLSRLNLGLSYKQRSQHHVKAHFRKAKPSKLQLEIAKRENKVVPEGHTYVQAHYRGVEGNEGQTVYRSRSAMALLYEAQPDPIVTNLTSTNWFGFERAVSVLLEKNYNFTIVHRAVRGKTDYGIDILATKTTGTQIETWVVQCKCYKPSNLVNPSHMRELIGSIADLQSNGVTPVRGMMVTTGRISGDALSLALKHGIQCVAGDDLNLILDSINKKTLSPIPLN
jgi:Restriction endonuclease